MSADDGPGTREVARRLFAAEYEDTSLSYSESDEERAPNYVVTPTGGRVNRLFVVGVLTEVESVNEEMLRARLVDPSGAFVAYAGQYQPDALAFFERHSPPEFVALSGKARTFQPDDSEQVFTSVRPESANAVDADTRDRWVVSAAEATLRRVSQFQAAMDSGLSGEALTEALRAAGVDESLAAGIPRAMDHYGTTTAYLEAVRRLAVDALEVVAGEREEVRSLDVVPDETGEVSLGPVPDRLAAAPLEASAAATEGAASGEPDSDTDTAEFEDAETPTPSESTADDESSEPTDGASEPEPAEATVGGAGGDEAGEPTVTESAAADDAASTGSADADEGDDTGAEAGAGGSGLNESEPAGEFSEAHAGEEEVGDEDEAGADPEEAADGIEESGSLGDFDAGAGDDEPETEVDEDEMYELDEEERREVEEEFDVGFESGAEVGDPGEAGIETPDPEDLAEAEAAAAGGTTDAAAEAEAGGTEPAAEPAADPDADADSPDGEEDAGDDEGETADVDLEDAAVEAMADLDEGDGAERQEVVAVVVDEHGADPGAVEDAIQEALMDGQCYEPGDGRLKAI